MGEAHPPEYGQFAILVRHFLERFFNNEMVSADEEGAARLLLIACVAGLPNFIAAVYLWSLYHSASPIHRHHHVIWILGSRPYWSRVGDHYFFVAYSLVAMGIVTVFEWDLFFPDLIDLFVMSSLPIRQLRLFLARVAAISIFAFGFLLLANLLSTLVLPLAVDPPSIWRFLEAHTLAVAAAGVFAAAFVLALQGVLLALLGANLFRRISLALQGALITLLLVLLCLSPLLAEILPAIAHSGNGWMFYLPPYWFLGLYQRGLQGPSALPVYARLAHRGWSITLLLLAVAAAAYPVAYWRQTRQLIEGTGGRAIRAWRTPERFFHAALCRNPARRAVCHFINQTLLRVPRYRINLVMYGGLGLSLAIAGILRLQLEGGRVRASFAADGIQAAIPIAAFWTIAGLRMAFAAPGDSRAHWIFRSIHGKPTLDHLLAAKHWALVWGMIVTFGVLAGLAPLAPAEARTPRALAGAALAAAGLCLLLDDLFFLNVKIIPFTRPHAPDRTNLATALLKYIAFFPPLVLFAPDYLAWIEASLFHMLAAAAFLLGAHWWLRGRHRRMVREHFILLDLEEDEDEFPLKLGLRS
jgi:hypothetical protein